MAGKSIDNVRQRELTPDNDDGDTGNKGEKKKASNTKYSVYLKESLNCICDKILILLSHIAKR